ncbi:MAG: DUF58 domain-containing protein [Lysobacterales bacterium]
MERASTASGRRRDTVIDAATLAAIDDLELAGRMLATGYLFGRHLGQRHGPGYEFAQYRAWQPGDASRTVDWRLYARSQRLNVRESELETDQRLWLLLDTSASMSFASPGGAINKFFYAKALAAALGYLAQQQGDELGLVTLGEQATVRIPASSGRSQWYRVLAAMRDLPCEGSLGDGDIELPANFSDMSAGSLVIVLSDFYQTNQELQQLLIRLKTAQCDVRALCLETHAEQTLKYKGVVQLIDPETGEQRLTDPAQSAGEFVAAREAYLQTVRNDLAIHDIAFERFSVDEPLDHRLRQYLTGSL